MCAKSVQLCPALCKILWTVARQAPLFTGFFRLRILEWVATPSSVVSSDPGMEATPPTAPAPQEDSLLLPPGKPRRTDL